MDIIAPQYLDKADRLDNYHPHKLTIKPELLSNILVQPIGKILGFNIWIVDGRVIRDSLDVDFTTGGNPGRYTYVPNDELWVETRLAPDDAGPSLLHESIECYLMTKHDMSYSNGHDIANLFEWHMRQNIKAKTVVITDMSQICSIIDPMARAAVEYINKQISTLNLHF